MKSFVLFVVIVLGALAYAVTVNAIVAQPVAMQDVKSADTALGYFAKKPLARNWNFKGGAVYNASTKNLDVYSDWAQPSPTPGPTNGTCSASDRNHTYTIQGGAGVKDLTYQCCKSAADTYLWLAGYCQ